MAKRLVLDLDMEEEHLLVMAVEGYRSTCRSLTTPSTRDRAKWERQLVVWDLLLGKIQEARDHGK